MSHSNPATTTINNKKSPLDPLSYFIKISEQVRNTYHQVPTWAHIIVISIDQAKKFSSYANEPLLLEIRREMQQRVLSKITRHSSGQGLSVEDFVNAAEQFNEYATNQKISSNFLQDGILHWLADYPIDISDWTLNVWYNLLNEYQLKPAHFVGQLEWGSSKSIAVNNVDNEVTLTWQEEINELVGLSPIKQEIQRLRDFLKIRQLRQRKGFSVGGFSLHQVFLGNPGTGKTSVARIMAKVYKEFGFLSKGHLVETDRSGLVGEYIGATEAKTEQVIRDSLGGVLFIDEAYSLTSGGHEDFGSRAIDTLVKMMEDHRDDLVVIVAGYEQEMNGFLESNTGLASRFTRVLDFQDYNETELVEIFKRMAERESYCISTETMDAVSKKLNQLKQQLQHRFGNAREVRNVWEKSLMHQAERLLSHNPDIENMPDKSLNKLLLQLTAADIA